MVFVCSDLSSCFCYETWLKDIGSATDVSCCSNLDNPSERIAIWSSELAVAFVEGAKFRDAWLNCFCFSPPQREASVQEEIQDMLAHLDHLWATMISPYFSVCVFYPVSSCLPSLYFPRARQPPWSSHCQSERDVKSEGDTQTDKESEPGQRLRRRRK